MAKLRKKIPFIVRYRMGSGLRAIDIAEEAKISKASVSRLERGLRTGRVTMAKYLATLGINMNEQATWPEGFQIIDEGEGVRIPLES